MTDNYGHLLESGTAPTLDYIDVDHPARDKKYRCDSCANFVWQFQLADYRKVPAALKGSDPAVDFACDGCLSTWERRHQAALPTQPANPGPKLWKGLSPTQSSDWRAKQKNYRDQVKTAQDAER